MDICICSESYQGLQAMAITERSITKSALTVMMRPLETTSTRETRGHQKDTIDHNGSKIYTRPTNQNLKSKCDEIL